MGLLECAMDDNQRLAFWQVEWAASSRRKSVWFLSSWGIALVGISLFVGQQGFWITLLIGMAVASAGVSSGCADPSSKPPEPKLELVDERYRIKATGNDGIVALSLIAAFREQEDRKAQRLLIWIGVAFGISAVALGFHNESVLSALISATLAMFFMAWALKIKRVQVKGFGVDLKSSDTVIREK